MREEEEEGDLGHDYPSTLQGANRYLAAITETQAVFPSANGGRHIRGEDLWHKKVAQSVLDRVVTCDQRALCATPIKRYWLVSAKIVAEPLRASTREISCLVLHMWTQSLQRGDYLRGHLITLGSHYAVGSCALPLERVDLDVSLFQATKYTTSRLRVSIGSTRDPIVLCLRRASRLVNTLDR
jgi:hypothetical protein